MTSYKIKTSLLKYFREKRNFVGVSVEVPIGNRNVSKGIADVMAFNDNEIIEVEIKISKSDLRADAKKERKHYSYNNDSRGIPNKLFYCVPVDLIEYTKQYLVKSKYGIMSYNEDKVIQEILYREKNKLYYSNQANRVPVIQINDNSIYIEKRAKILTDNISNDLKNCIAKSSAMQLKNMYQKLYYAALFEMDNRQSTPRIIGSV